MDVYKNVEFLKRIPYGEHLLYKKERYPRLNIAARLLKLKIPEIFYEKMSRPIMIDCETINTCTNDCIFCAYGMMKRNKIIMPTERFEKVLQDYSEIGGGYLSLTPRGEIFLDPYLVKRMSLLGEYPRIKGVSVTTNAVPIDRFSDDELMLILNSLIRIHISIYGLDREEHRLITQRDFYPRVVSNIKKITEIVGGNRISLGFRLLKKHSDGEIKNWIKNSLGIDDVSHSYTYTYTDWRGAHKNKTLPFEGKWQKRVPGECHCLMPLVEGVVYSNGDVSLCPCTEFDIIEEFKLGNIDDNSLSEIFNSNKNKELWSKLPKACMSCSYYRPITELSRHAKAFQDPISLIGG